MSRETLVDDLVAHLRDHIIGALHVGSLRSGDRLPSTREVARKTQRDQRAVARAYHLLELEGLVQVRGRSGVFIAPQSRFGGGILEETADWLAGVLLEGWKRRISILEFPKFARSCALGATVRCAFVDSCEDVFETFGPELRDEFGLRVDRVWLQSLPSGRTTKSGKAPSLPAALYDADLVVTTIFNAAAVRALLQRSGKPLIILSIHPNIVEGVLKHLHGSERVTLVCVDQAFADRLRGQYQQHLRGPEQIRVVLADDKKGIEALDRSQPMLVSRAAQKRLGRGGPKPLVPYSPSISPTSAREIIRFLIRMNADRVSSTLPRQ